MCVKTKPHVLIVGMRSHSGSVFIAEMADKTQLVTLLFAADIEVSKLTVFIGSDAELILASAIGVLAGSLLSQVFNVKVMSLIAGAIICTTAI